MPNSPTLKRTLTLKYVVFFGLAFMAPKNVFLNIWGCCKQHQWDDANGLCHCFSCHVIYSL